MSGDNKILKVIENKFVYENKTYTIDDMFSREFYHYSDEIVGEYTLGEITDNVVYMLFIQPVLALEYFIKNNGIEEVQFENIEYSTWVFVAEAADLAGINTKNMFRLKRSINRVVQKMLLLGTKYYLFATQLEVKHEKRALDLAKDVCVIRTTATKKKIKPDASREMLFEDSIGRGDLYTMFPLSVRLLALREAYKQAVNHYRILQNKMKDKRLVRSKELALDFYAKRLVHTYFYGQCINKLLELPWEGKYITGNNLDAYALLEERVAHSADMEIVCIPHGLEYGFKLPHCFVGDIFYATSEHAKNYLNKLYQCDNFIFDKNMANQMFSLNTEKVREKRVVYFSEPRESNVNLQILEELYSELSLEGIPLYIKHHPKDIKEEYKHFEGKIKEIEDLSEALTGNICIARKSTVLLEALYNSSESAAIVINVKDDAIFNTFPSLQDERIQYFVEVSELSSWIKSRYTN